MLKKMGRRWVAVPVALIAAAGFATTSGALSSTSRTERVCANLDAKEARQQANLASAPSGSRRSFILQFQISQTEKQEANHGCGD
jgi:hypothetical protein